MALKRQTIPIREVYSGMYDGPHATPKPSESGPIFLGIKNVGETGQLDLSDVRHISEEEYPRWIKRIEPSYGDIVFSYEATLNRYAMIPKGFRGCLGRRMALIRPDDSKICGRFLYYYFFSQEWRNVIAQNTLVGSTVDRIPIAKFSDFPITIPPLPTQHKIAATLSAYDNLIENNLRRIKILEEMAQNLYREWFVKFRFPGHQHTRFTDSPLGKIPEGWEVKTVENTFDILGGGTPSKVVHEYWSEGTINWYSPTDLTATGSMFMEYSGNQISELGLKKSSARLFPPFSVMMTSRATLGVISINTTEACTNQGFITCIPDEHFPLYTLYYWLKENVEYFISLGTGATFKEITKGVFKTIELVVPVHAIISQFEETMQPFALQILNLQRKNTVLRRTRDLLLPRLISGEMDVSELDIAVYEEAVI